MGLYKLNIDTDYIYIGRKLGYNLLIMKFPLKSNLSLITNIDYRKDKLNLSSVFSVDKITKHLKNYIKENSLKSYNDFYNEETTNNYCESLMKEFNENLKIFINKFYDKNKNVKFFMYEMIDRVDFNELSQEKLVNFVLKDFIDSFRRKEDVDFVNNLFLNLLKTYSIISKNKSILCIINFSESQFIYGGLNLDIEKARKVYISLNKLTEPDEELDKLRLIPNNEEAVKNYKKEKLKDILITVGIIPLKIVVGFLSAFEFVISCNPRFAFGVSKEDAINNKGKMVMGTHGIGIGLGNGIQLNPGGGLDFTITNNK